MDLLRAAMVGPAGTPYHDGLFFFDIKLPHDYPATPPQVRACHALSFPGCVARLPSHLRVSAQPFLRQGAGSSGM